MTKHLHLKKVLAAVLTIAALATGQQAFATINGPVAFTGYSATSPNNSTYSEFKIAGLNGIRQLTIPAGSSYTFSEQQFSCGPYSVGITGTLNFTTGTNYTDIYTGSQVTIVITSGTNYWFYGATVKKLDGTSVSGCSASASSDHTSITVTIPSGKTFGNIYLDFVPNEPLNNTNTVIGGIEAEYYYTGRPIEPVPTVTYKGTLLTEGTDYTLSYTNTLGPGSAWVTITGIGQYAGAFNHYYNIRAIALSDFTSLGNNTYQIATTTDLDHLAGYVKLNNDCQGLTFKQTADIAYTYTTAWNSSTGGETNFTAIGGWGKPFKGTFDGQNHSISGIRISKNGRTDSDKCQGLFGYVGPGGTVRNVVLADTRIKGYTGTGGIVGVNDGTIEDCRVQGNVLVKSSGIGTNTVTSDDGSDFGGIAGSNNGGTVTRCTSSVTIDGYLGFYIYNGTNNTINNYSNNLGGVVGNNSGTVSNCLALNAVVTGDKYAAAIVGNNGGTLTANHYRSCTVTNDNHSNGSSIGVGVGTYYGSEDQDGARSVHALTLGTDITATGESVVIDGTTYYASNTTVTLGYSGIVPAGQMPVYSVNGTAIEGNTFTMPTNDNATVSATFVSVWSGSGTSGSPYVITTTAQLDALAAAVKSGETYSGTYFVLGNDIAYSTAGLGNTDENFTPIGGFFNGSNRYFSGTFDGQGHSISGIRLYKEGGTTYVNWYQGLFGWIQSATIKNVILTDARITGYRYVGGIVGNIGNGKVQNCLVLASTITCVDSFKGALFGSKRYGTITDNYYHGCTVNGTANATNVGVGGDSGSSDQDGARSAHTLTLGENITAMGESVAYQGTTYYASNTTVTLGYNNLPAGYTVTYSLNGTALTGNTFTMPANDNAVVSATVTAPTYTKAIAAYHTENGVNYGWYLIASPIGTVNLTDVPHLFDNQYDLYYFDQTGGNNGKEWKNRKAHTNTFTTLESGIGYLYANSGNVTLEFTGVPYSGNGQVTLTKADGFEFSGWNLIGNPLGTAATLDKPFYRMNESGSALSAQIEANNSVAAMEGVFVQASTNNETATFTQVNNSKGGEKKDVPMLNINLSHNQGEVIDNTILRFDDGQTLEKFSFREGSTKIYFPQGGKDYAIACAEGQGEMPLNFEPSEDGTYTLNFTGNVISSEAKKSIFTYLHLIDNLTGADVDLLTQASYTFQTKTTDYESRFKLVFSSVCEDADDDNETFAYISNGNIIVNGEGTLQIFDALGRQVMRKQLSTVYAQLSTANFPAGVYMIRLINGENVRTQKVVVK